MADGGKRPFWMHQLVEYILGLALVASGMQSPYPVVPSVLGGIIILHAAITRGSLAAFRLIDRKLHRMLDPVIIGITVLGALQPWIEVDPGSRALILGMAVVHLFVWLGSSFTEKVKVPKAVPAAASAGSSAAKQRPIRTGDRSVDLGRSAGRLVGGGVKAVRSAQAKVKRSDD